MPLDTSGMSLCVLGHFLSVPRRSWEAFRFSGCVLVSYWVSPVGSLCVLGGIKYVGFTRRELWGQLKMYVTEMLRCTHGTENWSLARTSLLLSQAIQPPVELFYTVQHALVDASVMRPIVYCIMVVHIPRMCCVLNSLGGTVGIGM